MKIYAIEIIFKSNKPSQIYVTANWTSKFSKKGFPVLPNTFHEQAYQKCRIDLVNPTLASPHSPLLPILIFEDGFLLCKRVGGRTLIY